MKHEIHRTIRAIALALLVFILIGFVFALVVPKAVICEQNECGICPKVDEREGITQDELLCNKCSVTYNVFLTGVLNVQKKCNAQEDTLCEDGNWVGTRLVVYDNEDCHYMIQSPLLEFPKVTI